MPDIYSLAILSLYPEKDQFQRNIKKRRKNHASKQKQLAIYRKHTNNTLKLLKLGTVNECIVFDN
jgi:hypothetical protein